mmetsp:Transcript_90259/g.160775  ORF Transcript_90259/g.160775 Transcript_90259/m.160775 type:complete len:212 (-) Transcript_90259:206-841(-)
MRRVLRGRSMTLLLQLVPLFLLSLTSTWRDCKRISSSRSRPSCRRPATSNPSAFKYAISCIAVLSTNVRPAPSASSSKLAPCCREFCRSPKRCQKMCCLEAMDFPVLVATKGASDRGELLITERPDAAFCNLEVCTLDSILETGAIEDRRPRTMGEPTTLGDTDGSCKNLGDIDQVRSDTFRSHLLGVTSKPVLLLRWLTAGATLSATEDF